MAILCAENVFILTPCQTSVQAQLHHGYPYQPTIMILTASLSILNLMQILLTQQHLEAATKFSLLLVFRITLLLKLLISLKSASCRVNRLVLL
jgi:hypothetical protein